MSQKVSTFTIGPSRHQLAIDPCEILRLLLYGQSLQNGIACGRTQAPATLWLAKEHAHGERQFFFVSRANEKTIRAMLNNLGDSLPPAAYYCFATRHRLHIVA